MMNRQWSKILLGKISVSDLIFRKEVKLGSYSSIKSIPPAAIVATKIMKKDPLNIPQCVTFLFEIYPSLHT
jgi:DNA polymerase zeta